MSYEPRSAYEKAFPEIFIDLAIEQNSLQWKATRGLFRGKLYDLGLNYSAVASWLDSMSRARPPQLSAKGRSDLLAFLERQTPEFRANLLQIAP